MEPQGTCHVHASRKVDALVFLAVVHSFLQGGGVQGFAVTYGKIGRGGHIQTVFDGCGADRQLADAAAPPLDEQHILRLRVEMFQREIRFDSRAHCGIVPQNCIGLHGPGGCGLIPEQSDGGIGTAGGQAVL